MRKNQSLNFENSALAAGASALNQNCNLDIIPDASEVSQRVNPNLGHKRALWGTSRRRIEKCAGNAEKLVCDRIPQHSEMPKSTKIIADGCECHKGHNRTDGDTFGYCQSYQYVCSPDREWRLGICQLDGGGYSSDRLG